MLSSKYGCDRWEGPLQGRGYLLFLGYMDTKRWRSLQALKLPSGALSGSGPSDKAPAWPGWMLPGLLCGIWDTWQMAIVGIWSLGPLPAP